ncbi:hypothetical protein RMS29_001280 [Agrobacterium rosae]|uniref:Biotin transporter BioY n=1 Tax=Agrobacterium rosae TaxID=1972867 RepID=A0AAE5S1P2_9HYPH|nr:hypothetical protein [Agrobacterium rosae]KAA3511162.1 hypothetical protein DXM21_15120 [Agrobacterium rosae]KAA3518200.1 hypothetical protein DXM25_15170 [Agrobacterium rosae]MCM2434179.1 hypothetical protein [Agrobacterium rosae]MDX8329554.1 hypothetical protein [Agrobacterium rosae]MQB49463.1 hypothetical protein [Agrobacterium rosae]
MSGLETAIRNALEKSDRSSAEVRARIYQSSRQALEAGLRKQGIEDPEVVAQQRQRLETLVHAIESEERNRLLNVVEDHVRREAARAPAAPSPVRQVPPTISSAQSEDDVLPVEAELRGDVSEETTTDHDTGDFRADRGVVAPDARSASDANMGSLAFTPQRAAKARRKKRLVARLFIYFTLLAFLGFGAWWVYSSGLLLSPAERDTGVPNPPPEVQSEDFTGAEAKPEPSLEAGRGFSDAWNEIFNADRGNSGLQAGSLAAIEGISTPAGKAVRLTSRVAEADGNVSIAVPTEVLREMAGKSSTIAITLQSSSDRQTQLSISCDFGSLGDCARHRFTATPERADMLINVSFDRTLAPNSPGRIVINSDIDGNGRPVNLYSVRILPGE